MPHLLDDQRPLEKQKTLRATKVLLVPGPFGPQTHSRDMCVCIGYACETEVLKEALNRLDSYAEEHL